MATLREFLSTLATDRRALGTYIAAPEEAVEKAELSDEDARALLSRDPNQINARLMAEGQDSPVPLLVVEAEDLQRLAPGGTVGLTLVPTNPLTLPIQPLFQQLAPTVFPQLQLQVMPVIQPQVQPQIWPQIVAPQVQPQIQPQIQPLVFPQLQPQVSPVITPQVQPQIQPLVYPQLQPQIQPLVFPQLQPQISPVVAPQIQPIFPVIQPQVMPTVQPQIQPIFAPQFSVGSGIPSAAPVTTPVSVPPFTPDPPLMITNIPPLTIGGFTAQLPGAFGPGTFNPAIPPTVNVPNSPVMFQMFQPRYFG